MMAKKVSTIVSKKGSRGFARYLFYCKEEVNTMSKAIRSNFLFSETFFAVLVGSFFILSSCGGGGGGGGTPSGTPSDTTAPVTVASPAGGVYGTVQNVTLTANEAATIYYSLDGTDPSIGGANTKFGASPVTIQLAAGTTVLKFIAIDKAGNWETVKNGTYTIDLSVPTISLTSSAPGPFGLLASQNISYRSDKTGTFFVELGGTGTIGSGKQLATGTTVANTPINQVIEGTQLTFANSIPLWIYVTDQLGHTGSLSLDLSMKQLVTIPVGGGELRKIAVRPDGKKTYIACTDSNAVAVIDTDPLSGTYNTFSTIPVGTRPDGIAITPDGSRVYVTNQGETSLDIDSISVIATSTNQVIATIPLGSNTAPGGIAISIDGKRGYFTSFDGYIYILDTDPVSPTFNLVIGNIPRTLLLYGNIAMAPDGKKGIVNWMGSIAHAVDVLDVDPLSPTFNTIRLTGTCWFVQSVVLRFAG
jgi:YVTN family beta-propeller protein